jgi:hypothetical protein
MTRSQGMVACAVLVTVVLRTVTEVVGDCLKRKQRLLHSRTPQQSFRKSMQQETCTVHWFGRVAPQGCGLAEKDGQTRARRSLVSLLEKRPILKVLFARCALRLQSSACRHALATQTLQSAVELRVTHVKTCSRALRSRLVVQSYPQLFVVMFGHL